MSITDDMVGVKYGRLTATAQIERRNSRKYVLCKCDCGVEKYIYYYSLTSGVTKSCGCLQAELTIKRNYKHGFTGDNFFWIWSSMLGRCKNKNNKAYKNYGARGIVVCDEWQTFINFKEDMYESYITHIEIFGKKNTSIERTNNNEGYSKENCMWATNKEQASNTRKNKLYKATHIDGEVIYSRNISAFARNKPVSSGTIINCLKNGKRTKSGWSFEYV